ncbi:hypothetical protein BSK66_17535 [Paenibacillus odorifer]|uniref:Uncharacterized protein n=1 Tax=Paenibacillus odorifer TaxID=189426 RepID=A0A1R0X1U5_9BACL|nr:MULTISPECIES: hypothetical protein [Paenibacillus]ETT58838.1 hypothetical protein C171_16034 [Paenibacillus sp. FSL H8-237]OMD26889.1 hypothetical protein BJP51_26000 [Paenibacillus odorifer]OME55335.1 hypothetical protein BSK66_17535 [Paenibacillus odorifer]
MTEIDERKWGQQDPIKEPPDRYAQFLKVVSLTFVAVTFTIIFTEMNRGSFPLKLIFFVIGQFFIYGYVMKNVSKTSENFKNFCKKLKIKLPILYILYFLFLFYIGQPYL